MAIVVALLACLTAGVRGEVTYHVESRDDADLTIVRMTVTPAAEPVPALKYRLVARDIDIQPGNAAPYYYRALLETSKVMKHLRSHYGDEYDRWYATGTEAPTIAELPVKKLREADNRSLYGLIEEQLAVATSRRHCDWELGVEEVRGVDVIAFILSEFQESRELARLVALRTRLAIAEGRYDDAVEAMRRNYRLGCDVAQPPFLVCGLIGIAICGVTNGTAIEMIAQPDSPNLYWALSELPQPPIDMRRAIRVEVAFGPRIFPLIHNAEKTDHSPQEWNRLYRQSFRDLATIGGGNLPVTNEVGAGLVATGVTLLGYPHAKQQLIAQGMERERVERMAVGQVMAIYSERSYQVVADDFEKLWYVPFWEMAERHEELKQRLKEAPARDGGAAREVLPVAPLLLPALGAARTAQVRLEREVAALRVVEALRMFAASHQGSLPKSLDEITEVPVPLNPATGKPFKYRLDGRTAIFDLPTSEGFPGYNRRFEIKIATEKTR
jgi:hypothetical protein